MKFFATLATLALATTALASPVVERGSWPEKKALATRTNSSTKSEFTATPIVFCLLPAQATNIVNAFNYLLANPTAANFNTTATALLSSDWTDTSDSINQLIAPDGSLEGTTTFTSRSTFISSSSQQPPLYLQTLDILNSCNKIAWRWISINGTGNNQEKVKGIDVFNINSKGQIQATFAEFNSGAWLLDLGNPQCS